MAQISQLAPSATPGRLYSFIAKTSMFPLGALSGEISFRGDQSGSLSFRSGISGSLSFRSGMTGEVSVRSGIPTGTFSFEAN